MLLNSKSHSLLIFAFVITLFISGCAIFYKSNFPAPHTNDEIGVLINCHEGVQFGKKNGVKITSDSKNIFICSKPQNGKVLLAGPILPIFPAFGYHKWSSELRWVKFGMKKGLYEGFKNTDSIEILITKILYQGEGDVILSPNWPKNIPQNQVLNKFNPTTQFKIYSEKDFWLGIPGKGKIEIEFEATGIEKTKIIFEPKTGYSFGFLTA